MSSNAAAIRRRVNQPNPPPPQPQNGFAPNIPNNPGQTPQPPQTAQNGLTLPQVISLVDKRLIVLETFMKETKDVVVPKNSNTTSDGSFITEIELNTVIDEFNNRFEILATEINEIKDLLLKLQSYTMEVNKMLLTERDGKTFSDSSLDKSLDNIAVNDVSLSFQLSSNE